MHSNKHAIELKTTHFENCLLDATCTLNCWESKINHQSFVEIAAAIPVLTFIMNTLLQNHNCPSWALILIGNKNIDVPQAS